MHAEPHFGTTGARSCLVWIDTGLSLIRIYVLPFFGNVEFADGDAVGNVAYPC
jgi:hypothetical protein